MSSPRFTPELKEEAVRQVTQRGYSVTDVAKRIGVSANSLHKWVRVSNELTSLAVKHLDNPGSEFWSKTGSIERCPEKNEN